MKKPEIGDKIYYVANTLYYKKGKASPHDQIVICEGEVTGIIRGRYTQYKCRIQYKSVTESVVLIYPKLSDFGRSIFFSYGEAVRHADMAADRWDMTWQNILGEKVLRAYRPPA